MKPNPFDNQIHCDSSAFNGGAEADCNAAKEVFRILKRKKKRFFLPHSVATEMKHPKAPEWKRELVEYSIRTVEIPLTEEERAILGEIENIILAKASSEKRKADCMHVFEAQKYGKYFITGDSDIFSHSEVFESKYGLFVARPSEFLEILNQYAGKT